MNLTMFLLSTVGTTLILTDGRIFARYRKWEWMACPQCVGFWVGLGMFLGWAWLPDWFRHATMVSGVAFLAGAFVRSVSVVVFPPTGDTSHIGDPDGMPPRGA